MSIRRASDSSTRGARSGLGSTADLAEQILHPVVENAYQYGRPCGCASGSRARGSSRSSSPVDGRRTQASLTRSEGERIFEPGSPRQRRPGSTDGRRPSTSRLARRLARAEPRANVIASPPASYGRFVVRLYPPRSHRDTFADSERHTSVRVSDTSGSWLTARLTACPVERRSHFRARVEIELAIRGKVGVWRIGGYERLTEVWSASVRPRGPRPA